MKKLFMLGVLVLSMMVFTINVHATDVKDTGMDGEIAGLVVADTSSGKKITLTQDVNLGNDYLNVISGIYVIDLNGHALSGINNTVVLVDGDNASLTINDSSTLKTGKIICAKEEINTTQTAIHLENGSLTINGGIFESKNYGAYFQDHATINDGTFGNDDSRIGAVITKTATINNGVFKGDVGFSNEGMNTSDTLTINNGTFGNENSTYGMLLVSGKIVINNATVNTGADSEAGLKVIVYESNIIDLKIENINSTGGLAGLIINSQIDSRDNIININGGTFSGKMYGCLVRENIIPYTKISGGRFMSTNLDENNNFGGVVILKGQSSTYLTDPYYSFESAYTLSSLLKPGYNYSNRTFNEKKVVESIEDIVDTKTFSGTAKDVFIGAELEIDYSFFEESKEQTYKINKNDKLEFKLKPDYNLFENGGKVYVDDELVDQKNITSKSGSTIITLSKEYLDKLSIGTHTLKVTFNTDESAETIFTISREELNPKTGDGIMISIIIGSISLIELLGTSIYLKKKRFN